MRKYCQFRNEKPSSLHPVRSERVNYVIPFHEVYAVLFYVIRFQILKVH